MAGDTIVLSLTSASQTYFHSTGAKKVRIGRSQKCDFVIPVEDISREHCLFEIEGEKLFITDLSSKNGVFFNGIRITPNEKTLIETQFEIKISDQFVLNYSTSSKENANSNPVKHDSSMVSHTTQTRTVHLQLQENSKPKKVTRVAMSKKKQEKNIEEEKKKEWVKMVVGFTIISAVLLYMLIG